MLKSLFQTVNRKENLRTLDNLGVLGFDYKKKIPSYTYGKETDRTSRNTVWQSGTKILERAIPFEPAITFFF